MVSSESQWRRCSACKGPITVGATYWVCSVSTCNRKRTGLVFCSVTCWEVHLPGANHREAWAEERVAGAAEPRPAAAARPTAPAAAPLRKAPSEAAARAGEPQRRIDRSDAASPAGRAGAEDVPRELLIVASRLKDYIRARSGFNTSERVLGPLSDIVRRVCDEAIENARRDERKTVLDRDVPR